MFIIFRERESHLDVKGWIYEFVNLSIPMQKTCEYENMDGPHCNPAARVLLNGLKDEKRRRKPDLERFEEV